MGVLFPRWRLLLADKMHEALGDKLIRNAESYPCPLLFLFDYLVSEHYRKLALAHAAGNVTDSVPQATADFVSFSYQCTLSPVTCLASFADYVLQSWTYGAHRLVVPFLSASAPQDPAHSDTAGRLRCQARRE